jgi:flagellar assembly factor FliW
MPVLESSQFGSISYREDALLVFPRGLPGFEDRHRFLALSLPGREPLVFLQSADDPALCFVTLPVLAVEPAYQLKVSRDDLALVGLPLNSAPRIGDDVLCLTVICFRETGATANLLAPVVVNLRNLNAVQAVDPDCRYSHQQPFPPPVTEHRGAEAGPCS